MVIDAHGHLFRNPDDLDSIIESGVLEQAWIMDVSYFGDADFWMGRQLATQKELLTIAKRYKDFIVPFGYLDFRQPPAIVDQLKDMGFIGLKAICPPKSYDSPEFFPYYERAEQNRMPILFHCGVVSIKPRGKQEETPQNSSGINMTPMSLYTIARLFPRLIVIGAHLGGPYFEETAMVVNMAPNLYFDISGGHSHYYQQWLINHLHESALRVDDMRTSTIDHILFGVDATYGDKRIHKDILDATQYWELFFRFNGRWYNWGDQIDKILKLNARSIMSAIRKK